MLPVIPKRLVIARHRVDFRKGWDGLLESGTTTVNNGGRTFTLVPAQSKSRQSTKPEGVLHWIIADLATKRGCTFKPEDYDPGAT